MKLSLINLVFSYVVRRIKFVLTHVKGDVDILRKEFFFKGAFIECFLYPSNIVKENYSIINDEYKKDVIILLGNSAHKSNRHIDALNKLRKFKDNNIKIYCPLSYGDNKYAKEVIKVGKNIFNHKFIPLLDFIPLPEYKALLSNIDIAIFNNWRQQGMGNIITLLAMGKTIYLRQEVSTWDMLVEKGFKVKNFSSFESLETLTFDERLQNNKLALEIFSEERLVEQYKRIFN